MSLVFFVTNLEGIHEQTVFCQLLLCSSFNEITDAKRAYEANVITLSSSNKNQLFEYLKYLSSSKDLISTLIHNSIPISDNIQKAINILIQFLPSQFKGSLITQFTHALSSTHLVLQPSKFLPLLTH